MTKIKILALISIVGLATILPSCTPPKPMAPEQSAALPADEDSAAFLDRLSSTAAVSENDALRAVIILLDGQDKAKSFQERVDLLTRRGIIPTSWSLIASQPITKGRLAYMLCQACEIRGGLTMLLTGPSQRYCLRELQYRRMISDGAFYNQVTGMEMVGIIRRADAYRQQGLVPNQFATSPFPTGG